MFIPSLSVYVVLVKRNAVQSFFTISALCRLLGLQRLQLVMLYQSLHLFDLQFGDSVLLLFLLEFSLELAEVVFLLSDLLVPLFHLLLLLLLLLFQFLFHVDLGLCEPVELLLSDIVFLWVFQLKAFFDLYLSNHIPIFLILCL